MGFPRVFNAEQEAYLKSIYKGKTNREISKKMNEKYGTSFNEYQIRWYKTKHNLRSFEPLFTEDIVQYIKNNRYGKMHKELTDEVNKIFNTRFSYKQVSQFLRDHKMPTGVLRARPKIHEEGDSFERKDGHVYIKVNGKIRKKSRYIIEQSGIELQSTDFVKFLDGNQKNCNRENLVVVHKEEKGHLNHYIWTKNKYLNQCILDNTRLKIAIENAEQMIGDK